MSHKSHAIIVVDLGYGDSGKGSVVDALAHRYAAHTVIRYNGGSQAAHTVVTPGGAVHTFAQWGSATFLPSVHTYLSHYMLVDPLALLSEEVHLRSVGVLDAFDRLFIDERALLVTPFARALNRIRESSRGDLRHGSCGMGIGETVEDASVTEHVLRAIDLRDERTLHQKLLQQRERMKREGERVLLGMTPPNDSADEWRLLAAENEHAVENIIRGFSEVAAQATIVGSGWVKKLFQQEGVIIFEGGQGVLIDQNHGFHPYTTWGDTTTGNAHALLLANDFTGEVKTIGVLRAYATRHGPGPFIPEDQKLTELLPDTYNIWNEWQRGFRIGWFDAVASRYALRATGTVDALAITNLDRLSTLPDLQLVSAYKAPDASDVKRFGDGADGAVFSDIRSVAPPDIAHQALLTTFLKTVEPVLTSRIQNDEQLISEIERQLGVKVALVGRGPARDRKDWKSEIIAL